MQKNEKKRIFFLVTTKSEQKKIATIVTSGAITTNQKKTFMSCALLKKCVIYIYIYCTLNVKKKKVLLRDTRDTHKKKKNRDLRYSCKILFS